MLHFSSLCDHTQQLHDFLEQHYVLMQTWWCGRCGEVSSIDYACFSFVCFRRRPADVDADLGLPVTRLANSACAVWVEVQTFVSV